MAYKVADAVVDRGEEKRTQKRWEEIARCKQEVMAASDKRLFRMFLHAGEVFLAASEKQDTILAEWKKRKLEWREEEGALYRRGRAPR